MHYQWSSFASKHKATTCLSNGLVPRSMASMPHHTGCHTVWLDCNEFSNTNVSSFGFCQTRISSQECTSAKWVPWWEIGGVIQLPAQYSGETGGGPWASIWWHQLGSTGCDKVSLSPQLANWTGSWWANMQNFCFAAAVLLIFQISAYCIPSLTLYFFFQKFVYYSLIYLCVR